MPAPKLANLRGVELMHTGSWALSSGPAQFTRADLIAAVAALACPAVRSPVLKLGHVDDRFDGQPAVGWVANLHTERDGHVLLGDYQGLPAWLTEVDMSGNCVIASAFPDRSIEGYYNFECQLGHCHPFVVTAVALLGVMPPGIGTLSSLQDIAALYSGVAASVGRAGTPVTVTIHASSKGTTVPDPNPVMVSASVTLDDLREEFREASSYDQWITEVVLNPLQLIVMDDGSSSLLRVPVTIDDADNITFGTAVPVRVSYVDDVEDEDEQRIAAGARRIVYASRAESRPDKRPVRAADPTQQPAPVSPPSPAPTVPAAGPVSTHHEEDSVSLSEIARRLGLPDDADEQAILAALDAQAAQQPPPAPTQPDVPAPADPAALTPTAEPAGTPTTPAPPDPATSPAPEREPAGVSASSGPVLPPGTVVIDRARLEALEVSAAAGVAAHRRQLTEDRDRYLSEAVRAGKFPPARVEHWRTAWNADPEGTKATIDTLAAGLIPVEPKGYAGKEPAGEEENFDAFFRPGTLDKLKEPSRG